VSIVEMARNMIRLSGFEPEKDIPIVFSGIRPGEKLAEKLYWDGEDVSPTEHEKILLVKNTKLDTARFKEDMRQLEEAAGSGDTEQITKVVSQMGKHHLGLPGGYPPFSEKASDEET
jgi:FlaA1/EpsC-like NDP-sugar epimerase